MRKVKMLIKFENVVEKDLGVLVGENLVLSAADGDIFLHRVKPTDKPDVFFLDLDAEDSADLLI